MKDRMRNWIHGESEIANHIRKGFLELFSTSHYYSQLAEWTPPFWQAGLHEADVALLEGPITDVEIRSALWSLKPYKAPEPGGFHAGFFQRFYPTVGSSIREEVKSIFSLREMLDYLNKTLITLIPKCSNLETLGNYHPISLCNSIYKVVTKIIVARLRSLLAGLVSPLQTAFVPSKEGVDNAIIMQELVHSMSRKKGRVGVMEIKIDLEKAYDWMEWSFIRDTLNLFRFPRHLITLIMSCVSSSPVAILFNEGALNSFNPLKGIRQEDPLFPYLFILCMEVLGALINKKCDAKLWNPVKSSQGGVAFSHLFFADNLVLFAKVDRKNCVAVRDVLDTICSFSGQKVSMEKS